jgi:hypothetical protein
LDPLSLLTLCSAPTTLKELIETVEKAYDEYDVEKFAIVFITM